MTILPLPFAKRIFSNPFFMEEAALLEPTLYAGYWFQFSALWPKVILSHKNLSPRGFELGLIGFWPQLSDFNTGFAFSLCFLLPVDFPFFFQIWLFKNFWIIFNPTFLWIWSRKDVHISWVIHVSRNDFHNEWKTLRVAQVK